MLMALKVICGIFAALLAFFGASWWFSFDGMGQSQGIQALSNVGQNNLIADLGALFFGAAILIVLGLRRGHSHWLLSAALLLGVAAVGRLYSYATIGYEPATLPALIIEVVSTVILWLTHSKASQAD